MNKRKIIDFVAKVIGYEFPGSKIIPENKHTILKARVQHTFSGDVNIEEVKSAALFLLIDEIKDHINFEFEKQPQDYNGFNGSSVMVRDERKVTTTLYYVPYNDEMDNYNIIS